MDRENLKTRNIVFFDGECHLCNGFVDALISRDKTHVLRFASLQGETAKLLLGPEDRESLDSVVYFEAGKIHHRSEAVLRILNKLGGVYQVVNLGRIIPGFLRDTIYKWIADNRYSWFGKRDSCRIPLPEEREHLLP